MVDVAFPVLKFLVLSKTANFPFRPIDYSPWSSKNLIDQNWLKKFMQVSVDVTCMYTNFGGHDLSGFGDNITSQKRPIFPFNPSLVKINFKDLERSS